LLLSGPDAQDIRREQRRYRHAKPPAIKELLQRGVGLQQQLRTTGLTRSALARRLKLDPSRITQILNLTNLTPSIQEYILNLQPTKHRSSINDSQWMRLARIRDHQAQTREFKSLLKIKNKTAKLGGSVKPPQWILAQES